MKNPLAFVIIAAVVAAALGFVGGMQYQKTTAGRTASNQFVINTPQGVRRFGNGQANVNTRGVRGQIQSSDDNSLTVKLADGSTKLVLLTESTTITQATSATKSDLMVGKEVQVFGPTNSDGSVTAVAVSLNPQNFRPATGSGTANPPVAQPY